MGKFCRLGRFFVRYIADLETVYKLGFRRFLKDFLLKNAREMIETEIVNSPQNFPGISRLLMLGCGHANFFIPNFTFAAPLFCSV